MSHSQNRIDTVRPDAPEQAGYGPFPVGVRTLTFEIAGQIDVARATKDSQRLYDRPMTVELWYPATPGTAPGGSYDTLIRDGRTTTRLFGRAAHDAAPAQGRFPLVVISHGYPGNRFLLSHLGETLASRGFVTAAPDHADSTYADQGAFGATLYHRPLDQRAVIDHVAATVPQADTDRTGVIGYSMGGYGALVFAGAGVTPAAASADFAPPAGLLSRHISGSETHAALIDPRVRAAIAIGPWGNHRGIWDTTGLAQLAKPLMIIAGSLDEVSDYTAMRGLFAQSTGTTRHLLTFQGASHNAAAPIPAPAESWGASPALDFIPFEHYADPVWDTVRMNNIAQHFAAAFLSLHLKRDKTMQVYLDDTFAGFAPGSARALTFETLTKGH
ncbi:alpha/beta hydrolase family protein [Ruegeria marina]|uniref:Predicted dienelactone hydrolase n=1 Tax=Ruegeria marina TaxID=639004 RepID=A0A1G6SAU3_9RHOB|nr:dienelactone hydrolase family protein [Ruegeria marina]SDD13346.1 Predicted dienelactone hydrolase [Ruegeria marina]